MTTYCKECGKELLEFKAFILMNAYCYVCYFKVKKLKEGDHYSKKTYEKTNKDY